MPGAKRLKSSSTTAPAPNAQLNPEVPPEKSAPVVEAPPPPPEPEPFQPPEPAHKLEPEVYEVLKSFAETVKNGGQVSLRDLKRLIPKEEKQQVLEKFCKRGSGSGLISTSVLQRPHEMHEEQLKGARRSTMPRGRGR